MTHNSSIKLLVLSDLHLTGEGNRYLSRKYVDKATNVISTLVARRSKFRNNNEYKSAGETLTGLKTLFDRHIEDVDQIIISGDLMDSGRLKQLSGMGKILSEYPREKFSFVPGNHDLPLFGRIVPRIGYSEVPVFAEHLFEPEKTGSKYESGKILFTKQLGTDFLLIGINYCRNNNLHFRGKIGPNLLSDLESILKEEHYKSLIKIIIMHHNPIITDRMHYDYLTGREQFLKVVSIHSGESGRRDIFVLFGHSHYKTIKNLLFDDLCFICTPMFALKNDPDHILLQIHKDGTFDDLPIT